MKKSVILFGAALVFFCLGVTAELFAASAESAETTTAQRILPRTCPSCMDMELNAFGAPVILYYDNDSLALKLINCSDIACSSSDAEFVAFSGRALPDPDPCGACLDLALDHLDRAIITFYDSVQQDLLLLQCEAPDSCANPTVTTIDSVGDVGQANAVALMASGSRPVASYADVSNDVIKLAICDTAACSNPTLVALDDLLGDRAANKLPRMCPSCSALALNSLDQAVIYFYHPLTDVPSIAFCNVGCSEQVYFSAESLRATSSPDQQKQPTSVAGSTTCPRCADIALFNDLPTVAYYHIARGGLRLLTCDDTQCSSYDDRYIDCASMSCRDVSLSLDNSGRPIVAYYDAANGDLKLASCDSRSCDGALVVQTVASARTVGQGASMALPPAVERADAKPLIAFMDTTHGELVLANCESRSCQTPTMRVIDPAASLIVNSTLDAVSDDGMCTLREAVLNANGNDQSGSADCAAGNGADNITFNLAAGSVISMNTNTFNAIPISDDLTINGLGASDLMLSTGPLYNRGFFVIEDPITLLMRDITLRDAGDSALRIAAADADVTLERVHFRNNQDTGGGAIALAQPATLTIVDSEFHHNRATSGNGGALLIQPVDATVAISNTLFYSNTATNGGGAISKGFSSNGIELTVYNSVFDQNSSGNDGGAFGGGNARFMRTTFSGNRVETNEGGAIAGGAGLVLINSTLSGNHARNGGAIYHFGGSLTHTGLELIHTTIVSNTVTDDYPGIYVRRHNNSNVTALRMHGNIMAHNVNPAAGRGGDLSDCGTSATGSALIVSTGYNWIESGCGSHLLGTDMAGVNIVLGPLLDNGGTPAPVEPPYTHQLLHRSAWNMANCNGGTLLIDQRGVARPSGSLCEPGAYEVNQSPTAVGLRRASVEGISAEMLPPIAILFFVTVLTLSTASKETRRHD